MELSDNLNEIKENLFDAPAEVKSAFNDVVEYFSNESSEKKWFVINILQGVGPHRKFRIEVKQYPVYTGRRWNGLPKIKGFAPDRGSKTKYSGISSPNVLEIVGGPFDSEEKANNFANNRKTGF